MYDRLNDLNDYSIGSSGKFDNVTVEHLLMREEEVSLTKSFKKTFEGLYKFGDYVGKISGVRDMQNPSVMGNIYQEQASSDLKAVASLSLNLARNPSVTTRAIQIWSGSQNQNQLKMNSLVTFSLGIAKLPVGIISATGHTFESAREINSIYNSIK